MYASTSLGFRRIARRLGACSLALALLTGGPAAAQVAGSTAISVTVTDAHEIALGWSAKRSILGKTLYTETGAKIGKVSDLIITPDRHLSYLIAATARLRAAAAPA